LQFILTAEMYLAFGWRRPGEDFSQHCRDVELKLIASHRWSTRQLDSHACKLATTGPPLKSPPNRSYPRSSGRQRFGCFPARLISNIPGMPTVWTVAPL